MVTGAPINVLDFGADPTGVASSSAAIQAAIDFAILGGDKQSVYVPAGIYKITDTIQLGYGVGYNSCILEGAGYKFRGESQFNGTVFICASIYQPGINIQGGFGSQIRNLAIIGPMMGFMTSISDANWAIESSWVNAGYEARCDSRYAPGAAITIDAYSGNRPVVSYPDVNYPASLGTVAQYNKDNSQQCLIENVMIEGFVAGIVIKPSDDDNNGDYTTIRKCRIDQCKYAISVGNFQHRNLHIDDVACQYVWIGLTNNVHGKQRGQINGTISCFSTVQSVNFLQIEAVWAGPTTFLNCYTEAQYRIGDIYGNYTQAPTIIFQSCYFYLQQNTARGIAPTALGPSGGAGGSVLFKGCDIQSYPSVVPIAKSIGVRFDDCFFYSNNVGQTITEPYKRYAFNATCDGVVVGAYGDVPTSTGIQYWPVSNATGVADVYQYTATTTSRRTRTYCLPFTTQQVLGVNGTYNPNTKLVLGFNKATQVSSASLVNKTLTITLSGINQETYELYGGCPGDILIDENTMSVFFVRSRVTNTIIAELQNNYKESSIGSGVFTPVTPISLSVGIMNFRNTRLYTPSGVLRGTATLGSANITAVGDDSSANSFITAEILADDRLVVNTQNYLPFAIANSKVVTVNAGSSLITLDSNALYTRSVSIDVFSAVAPANA